jgi:hypothetical protein
VLCRSHCGGRGTQAVAGRRTDSRKEPNRNQNSRALRRLILRARFFGACLYLPERFSASPLRVVIVVSGAIRITVTTGILIKTVKTVVKQSEQIRVLTGSWYAADAKFLIMSIL